MWSVHCCDWLVCYSLSNLCDENFKMERKGKEGKERGEERREREEGNQWTFTTKFVSYLLHKYFIGSIHYTSEPTYFHMNHCHAKYLLLYIIMYISILLKVPLLGTAWRSRCFVLISLRVGIGQFCDITIRTPSSIFILSTAFRQRQIITYPM